MTCHLCGDYAGRYKQHRAMREGFSLCSDCALVVGKITPPDQMELRYGEPGVNYPNMV